MKIVDELQGLLESVKVRLESARQQAAKAKAEEEMLSNDLVAYQRIIEALTRNSGDGGLALVVAPVPPAAPASPPSNRSGTEPKTNVAKLVRQAVLDNRVAGSTTTLIFETLERKGARCSPTYLYSRLSKMKKSGLILKKDGKFFPSEMFLKLEAEKQTVRAGVKEQHLCRFDEQHGGLFLRSGRTSAELRIERAAGMSGCSHATRFSPWDSLLRRQHG
jgi:hypothetical protein